jgi:phosphatidylserine/phosphatidylglycerophosphate/cardiolipin synthase-like enzyme
MKRFAAVFLLSAVLLPSGTAPAAARVDSPIRLSGVFFDALGKGHPEPESAVRITNTDTRKKVPVGGYGLTDRFTPGKSDEQRNVHMGGQDESVGMKGSSKGSGSDRQTRGARGRTVRLPSGAVIPPGGELWIAHQGRAFRETFGYKPDYELVDTLPDVPDLDHDAGWLIMPAKHGSVALLDSYGQVVDYVVYDRNKTPKWTADDIPDDLWDGPPVRLYKSSFYGWSNQILTRDRDERGRLLKDTDTFADWDSGNSKKQLGTEPTHRIELPGQSFFIARPLKRTRAKVLATSAPDNNYKTLVKAIRDAKKRIRISIYQITNPYIVEELIKKQRQGVKVKLWLEGSPVGGIPDQERFVVDKLAKAGATVHFLISDTKKKIRPRYRFDHSKYVLIDDDKVIIGTENYGRTGVPVENSFGNRGWMVHVQNPQLFKQLDEVWKHDYRVGEMRDVVGIDDNPHDAYGMPYREKTFEPDDTIRRGMYEKPADPVLSEGKMDLELVLSPDTSLNEKTGLIGLIRRAKKTLYIEQNSIRRKWGRREDKMEDTPDLLLAAVIEAARRGVKTRVLMDGYWYNTTGDDDRDNDDVARMLNEMAREEKLDLSAKVINLQTAAVEKIHAKGIIVDHKEVFVGSINWTENSFKGNREVGVIVGDRKVAGYYASLFERDWSQSRMYTAPAKRKLKLFREPKDNAKTRGSVDKGAELYVIGEHKGTPARGPAWLEVRVGFGKTAFVRAAGVGIPTARPNEALHLLNKRARVEGRVAMTRVSSKVIQLKFMDEKRPPFVAVIFRKSEPKFRAAGINPAQAFQGRRVRVFGTIQAWKQPEIILTSPDQIEILP